jgi:hypothetical protein
MDEGLILVILKPLSKTERLRRYHNAACAGWLRECEKALIAECLEVDMGTVKGLNTAMPWK